MVPSVFRGTELCLRVRVFLQETLWVWQREPLRGLCRSRHSVQALGPDLGGQFREADWLHGAEQVTHSESQLLKTGVILRASKDSG